MPIRTASDFLESLKDGRDILIEGGRVRTMLDEIEQSA